MYRHESDINLSLGKRANELRSQNAKQFLLHMNQVMEKTKIVPDMVNALANKLGLSETHYTIIISVWKQISEAVKVILSHEGALEPSRGLQFPGQNSTVSVSPSFSFPDVRSPDAIHFI